MLMMALGKLSRRRAEACFYFESGKRSLRIVMGFLIAEVGLPSGKGATQKIYFLIPFCLENEADKKNK